MENKVQMVVLAAGKGTRMGGEGPKVLSLLFGKHMIKHLLESMKSAWEGTPIIVVGHMAKQVKEELGENYSYVVQEEQLGTAHAVSCAREACGDAENVMALYGDQPLISSQSMKNLIEAHMTSGATITLTTVKTPDFQDWRKCFMFWGRILRKDGKIVKIIEYPDTTEEEKEIKEVNSGVCIFNAKWFWDNLDKVKNENSKKEYYLVDIIDIASRQGEKIEAFHLEPEETLGANTKEELEIMEKFARKSETL